MPSRVYPIGRNGGFNNAVNTHTIAAGAGHRLSTGHRRGKATAMAAKGAFDLAKKYTQEPTGIWRTLQKWLVLDSNRSTGIPVKHYRDPPPGGLDPKDYDDPVTVPAGDIADNPYWKRDIRRSYPKLSSISQADAVALLTVGNAATPSPKLLAGEEGSKQLVLAKEEGEKGLAAFFEKETGATVLGEGGMPPMPPSFKAPGVVKYELEAEQSYENKYPCRTFS